MLLTLDSRADEPTSSDRPTALLHKTHAQVLGQTYGIASSSVRSLVTAGKMVVIDLDKVEHAERLRAAGFKVRSCLS